MHRAVMFFAFSQFLSHSLQGDVFRFFGFLVLLNVQSNFNGSNSFGTMQISSRQGKFEPMWVDYSARSGGLIGISF